MRYQFTSMCALALAVVPLLGCSDSGNNNGNWAPLDYEANPASAKYDFGAADSAVAVFMSDYPAVEGVTLAVVRGRDGQIYEKGYGDFSRDRISLIASTTKVLSAGVILTLADDGLLELNRPVAQYLDWGEYHSTVTIEQLLSMMSGMGAPPDVEALLGSCSFDPATSMRECAREIFEDESGSVPPGEEFRYSESAWTLAGGVAEVVSGSPWAELLEEKLLTPCGLPNTGYANEGFVPGYPEVFDGDPGNLTPSENPSIGGGAYSTVNDYSKVLLMHLNGGVCGVARPERVLSSDMVRSMQEDLVPEGVRMPSWRPEAINYGMGWWKYEKQPGLLIDSGAWGARAVLNPADDWGAIMIIETTSADGHELFERLVPVIHAAVTAADQD